MFETPGFQNRPFLCYDMHAKTGREERSIFDNMKTKWKKTGGILLAVLVVLGVTVMLFVINPLLALLASALADRLHHLDFPRFCEW